MNTPKNNLITISKAADADIPGLAEIEKKLFNSPKPLAVFLSNKDSYYIARVGQEIAGYIGFEQVLDEGHISNIAVLTKFRRRGIASQMLQFVLKKAKRFFLEVRASNQPAINLYKKFGFSVIGTRKKYYSDNQEDALNMAFQTDRLT